MPIHTNEQDGSGEQSVGAVVVNEQEGSGEQAVGAAYVNEQDGSGEQLVWQSGPTVADSAIHHWRMDEGTGDTVADNIGTADGTRNGPTWTSGTWVGDYALDGDGTDDYVETTSWGTFGSQMDSNWAVSFSINTPTTTDGMLPLGVVNSDFTNTFFLVTLNGPADGSVQFNINDDSDNQLRVYGTGISANTNHRIVLNKTGNTGSAIEIYIDGTSVSTTIADDQNPTNFSDFVRPVTLFARNNGGSINANYEGVLDDVLIYDSDLTDQEIQDDYDRQPWT